MIQTLDRFLLYTSHHLAPFHLHHKEYQLHTGTCKSFKFIKYFFVAHDEVQIQRQMDKL